MPKNSNKQGKATALPSQQVASVKPGPLLIDVSYLAELLARSRTSLHRDAAAGRLPEAVTVGRSKRWRLEEITKWVEAGCPDRQLWEAMQA